MLCRALFAHTFSSCRALWICLAYQRDKRALPFTPFYCQTCSRPQASRLVPSCVHLSACLQIDLPVLFIPRFCREIFYRHEGHVILDLRRLSCRYFCLNISWIGMRALMSLVYPHLFLLSCLVDFYRYFITFCFLPRCFLHTSLFSHCL